MWARWAADLIVLLHFGFVVFVLLGGLLVLWNRSWAWIHVPAACWGVLVEATGWFCPLTGIENDLRRRAGAAGYDGGFVEHYVLPVLYPEGLTRELQWQLAAIVLVVNGIVYTLVIRGWLRTRRDQEPRSDSRESG